MHPQIINVRDAENPALTWSINLTDNTRTMVDQSGRTITMDLGPADVHIDKALANYAAGYRQWEGIADLVSPIVPVEKQSDKFYTWDKDDVFQDAEDLIVGPGGAVKEISPRLSNDNYYALGYGISTVVPTELSANQDSPLNVEMAAMRRCLNTIGLGRERRVAASVTTSGNWTGGYTTTIAAGAKWNGGASSNPIQDLFTAVEASLTSVTGISMSEQVWHDFQQNAAVQKYIAAKIDAPPLSPSNANNQMRIADQFAALLGLPPFLIGRMKGKATATTYGYVWGNNVALLHNDPGVPSDGQSISTNKTFRWTGADLNAPDGTIQGGFLVRSYFDPRRGPRGSRVIVVCHNDAEKMTSTVAGGLLINAHQ